MMKWWISQGYDPELAKKDRVAATRKLTESLKSKYDAVWFRGKGIRRLLDGDQIVVFDPNRVYQIDPKLSKPGDIGSKVVRKSDGMRGTIVAVRPVPPDAQQYHGGAPRFLEIKWQRGGKEYNVYDRDVEFVTPKTAADHYGEEGFWEGEGGQASGILPVCPSTGRIGLAWRSADVHIGNCYGGIGGAVKKGMSPAESAKHELAEETGYSGSINLIPAYIFRSTN